MYNLNLAATLFSKIKNHLGNLCYRDFAEVTLTHGRSPRWLNSKIFLPPKRMTVKGFRRATPGPVKSTLPPLMTRAVVEIGDSYKNRIFSGLVESKGVNKE
jgi:hypothetical protein